MRRHARFASVQRRSLLSVLSLGVLWGACVNPELQRESAGTVSRLSVENSIPDQRESSSSLRYPSARLGAVVDDYHGTLVADPYRWLEDPDSSETRQWVRAENDLTQAWLAETSTRDELRERLQQLWNYERYSLPMEQGGRYFYLHNDGLQEQSPLFVSDSAQGEGRLLLDPASFSSDGTVSLAEQVPSPDGKLLAYGTSDGGSDWIRWRFLDVESGERLPDEITRNKFGSLDWTADSQAVVYARFPAPTAGNELHERNTSNEVCMHVLGTKESEDIVLRAASPAGNFLWPIMTSSRKAVVIYERDLNTRNNSLEVISLVGASRGRGVRLVDGFDAHYDYIGNDGNQFWIQTDLGAPNGRLVGIDLFSPERASWRELIPEREQALEGAYAVGGRLILQYLRDAKSEVRLHETDGRYVQTLQLPGTGSVRGFSGELTDGVTWFSYTDFSTPSENWELEIASGKTRLLRRPQVSFDPALFETKQVFYSSKDGTRVPMFIVHRRDLELPGDHPTYLYGYGGFNSPQTPHFRSSNALWLERGGVYVVANLRGGSEYGEAWHQAGTKLQKQNVFDDFIAAAEWLVANGYTSPENLAIAGGSNGGLLVGACMTQRPELFGAALPAVGVMDMLRYQQFTIGRAWAGDYGLSENPEEFRALHAYSPLHNIRDGVAYPATLVTTGDHDDRVVPAHSYKFAARLQAAQAGAEPILIRIETRAGHGRGKSTSMRIDEVVDRFAFLSRVLKGG